MFEWMTFMPRNPAKSKKDALIPAFRARPPKPPETVNLNINLNVGGALTLQVQQVPPPQPSKAGVTITATFDGFTSKGKSPMAYTLPDEMMISVQVNYVDKNGNPAKVDGDTQWSSSDDNIAFAHVNADDSTRADIWGKSLGQAQITARADADLGEGQKEILATLDIEVVGGEAVSATITPSGEPQPIPMDAGGGNVSQGGGPDPVQQQKPAHPEQQRPRR